jgi:hypothetical protein
MGLYRINPSACEQYGYPTSLALSCIQTRDVSSVIARPLTELDAVLELSITLNLTLALTLDLFTAKRRKMLLAAQTQQI